jgi:transposase
MALIYSLVATCKLNDVNPYEYFYDILLKVALYPSPKIADITPINWKIDKK